MARILTTMANESRDEDTGKFIEKYDDANFVDAIECLGGAAGTAEIADELDCPHSTTYHRLDRLRETGRIESRQIGNAVLWEVKDDG